MKTAVSNIAWFPEERHDAYALLRKLDFSGLEIAPALFLPASDDPFRPDPTERRSALRELEEYGLSLVSMQSLLYGVEGAELFGDEDARGSFVHAMRRAIDLAGTLEIPNLVFGSPKQRVIPRQLTASDAMAIAADTFGRLAEHAVASGTRISIEPNPAVYGTNFLTHLREAAAFAAKVDHAGVRATFDLGTMLVNGEAAHLGEVIGPYGKLIGHVHISAPWLEPPQQPAEDIADLLRGARGAGYQGWFSIEMKRDAAGLVAVEHVARRLVAASAICGGRS